MFVGRVFDAFCDYGMPAGSTAAAPEQPKAEEAASAPAAEPTKEAAAAAPAEGGTPESMSLEEVEKQFGAVPKPSKDYVIGGIVKTLVNEHWQQVKAGYEAAAKDFGVKVEVIGADSEATCSCS